LEIFSDINNRLSENKKSEEGLATVLAALVAVGKQTARRDPEPILRELCAIASTTAQVMLKFGSSQKIIINVEMVNHSSHNPHVH
jgi:hypothetical protein